MPSLKILNQKLKTIKVEYIDEKLIKFFTLREDFFCAFRPVLLFSAMYLTF